MKRIIKLLTVVFILTISCIPVFAAEKTSTAPASGYAVSLSKDVSINMGEEARVTLNVNSEESTYNTYHYVLTYNPNILTYKSISGDATVTNKNGKLTIVGYGKDKAITDTITLTFKGKSVGSSDITITKANIDKSENAKTQNAPAATIEDGTATIKVTGYKVTLSDDFTGAGMVSAGADYTFKAKDLYYTYQIKATMGGKTVKVVSKGNGVYVIENVTGDLVIKASKSPKSFDVEVSGTGKSDVTLSGTTATYRSDYTFVLNRKSGYNYTVSVKIGGSAYSPSIDNDGKTYTISGKSIKGDIVITVTRTAASTNTTQIIFTGNGSGDVVGNNPAIANNSQNFTFKINKNELYDYTVRLVKPSQKLTANSSGVYTITKDKLTGETLTVQVTKSASVEETVGVTEYVKIGDGKSMFLITASGPLSSGEVYAYDGNAMSYSEKYEAYVYLVITNKTLDEVVAEAKTMISELSVTQVNISYDGDVNVTGQTDSNDAQLAYNMYNAHYSDFDVVSMDKFLRADMNHDKRLTVLDIVAIITEINN